MRPRVFPAEDAAQAADLEALIEASMRPRVFPAEDNAELRERIAELMPLQ